MITWVDQLVATRGRAILVLSTAILALAIAVVVHAAVNRYQVTHLAGLYFMRADRLTGRVQLCGARYRDGPVTCRDAAGSTVVTVPASVQP